MHSSGVQQGANAPAGACPDGEEGDCAEDAKPPRSAVTKLARGLGAAAEKPPAVPPPIGVAAAGVGATPLMSPWNSASMPAKELALALAPLLPLLPLPCCKEEDSGGAGSKPRTSFRMD